METFNNSKIMKNKWRTPYNHTELPYSLEVNNSPSQTVPDQTMSISHIMRRFVQGIPLDAGKVPVYHGDEQLPDIARMDLIDKEMLKRDLEETIKEGEAKLEAIKEHRKRKAAEKQQGQQKSPPLESPQQPEIIDPKSDTR